MKNLFDYPSGRDGTADLLKGLAVLLMIQVHLIELFAQQRIYNSEFGRISLFLGGPPAAPLFMAIMGYFVAASRRDLSQKLKRGAILFLSGILLNIALNLNLLIRMIDGQFPLLNPWTYIFGVDILPLAGISIVFIALMEKLFNKRAYLYFVLSLITASIGNYLPSADPQQVNLLSLLNAFFWGEFHWSYFPFLPWVSYPLAGYGFYLIYQSFKTTEIKNVYKLFFMISWVIFFVFTFEYAVGISSVLEIYYHHNFLFYLWCIFFLLGITFFASVIEYYIGSTMLLKIIKWIGLNVTAIYIFQWIIIGNIATEIYKTQNLTEVLIWYFIILTTVITITAVWNKYFSNWINFLTGKLSEIKLN